MSYDAKISLIAANERIAAAKLRLRDLKALHSDWYQKAPCETTREEEAKIINDMEAIAYSVDCYLDGVPGPYLGSVE